MIFLTLRSSYDLDVPSVERILELEILEQDPNLFSHKFGSSDSFSMADVFWNVSSIFSNWLHFALITC